MRPALTVDNAVREWKGEENAGSANGVTNHRLCYPPQAIIFFAEVTRHMFEIVFREFLRNYEELGHDEGMCGYI